jgi:hypothetical protein
MDDSSSSPRVRAAIWFFFFLIFFSIAWAHLVWMRQVPINADVLHTAFPHWQYVSTLWYMPRGAFWDMYRNMGQPFLADPQTMALYPVLWLLAGAGSFQSFTMLWLLFHSAVAAIFAFKLGRRVSGDELGGAICALAAAFGGSFAAQVSAPNQLAAASFLPAILFAQVCGSSSGLGLALALQWLAGSPALSLLSLVAVAAVAMSKGWPGFSKATLGLGIAMLISAPQWLTYVEFLELSVATPYRSPQASTLAALFSFLKMAIVPQPFWLSHHFPGLGALERFYVGPVVSLLVGAALVKGGGLERAGGLLLFSALVAAGFASHLGWGPPVLLSATLLAAVLSSRGLLAFRRPWRPLLVLAAAVDLGAYHFSPWIGWGSEKDLATPPPIAQKLGGPNLSPRLYHTSDLFIDRSNPPGSNTTTPDFFSAFSGSSSLYGFRVREVCSYQARTLQRAAAYQSMVLRKLPDLTRLHWAGADLESINAPLGSTHRSGAKPPLFLPLGTSKDWSQIVKYDPGYVVANVIALKTQPLVLSEVSYPGWKATINGTRVPLTVFQDTFLQITIPEGHYRVAFTFSPTRLPLGVGLMGLGIGFAAFLLYRRRPQETFA